MHDGERMDVETDFLPFLGFVWRDYLLLRENKNKYFEGRNGLYCFAGYLL